MESALLGLVLDSSAVIAAERNKQPVLEFIASIYRAHGSLDLSLSPISIAELAHGIYRSKSPEVGRRRRQYIEELVDLIPVHPVTEETGWLVAKSRGWRRQKETCSRSTI